MIEPAPSSKRSVGRSPVLGKIEALESQIGALYDLAPFGSHTVSDDGNYSSINALELSWLGCAREDLIGKRAPSEFLTPESRRRLGARLTDAGSRGFSDLELDLLDVRGRMRPVSMSALPIGGDGRRTSAYRFVSFDITDARRISEQQRVAAIAFETFAALCVTDSRGVILQINRAFTTLTGYSASEAVGKTMRLLHSGRNEPAFYESMWASLREQGSWQGEVLDRRKDGSVFVGWLSITAVAPDSGAVSNYIGSLFDITAARASQDELSRFAFFDSLTQLPNRRLLQDRLAQALAQSRRSRKHGAVIFLDLDAFKSLNDLHGHAAGDLLLQEVARRLVKCLRAQDTVSRQGGDEFVVLITELAESVDDAVAASLPLAEKIRGALAQPYLLKVGEKSIEHRCSASLGVAIFTPDEANPLDVLKRADGAMYRAKREGRNTVHVQAPSRTEP